MSTARAIPVEQCPFRDRVREQGKTEIARCRLLQEITGVDNAKLCSVRRDACEACCQSFPPSHGEINPVIASLLYQLTDQVIKAKGVDGCPTGKALALQSWATLNLEVEFSLEDLSTRPQRAAGPCGYLGPEIGSRIQATAGGHARVPVFECRHPDHRETTEAECQRCRDWAAKPGPAPSPLEQLVPPPAQRRGPRIRRWAVGVTTAPRRQTTLEWCLDSLARAGWERPRLFVDCAVTIPTRFSDLPVTFRQSKLGAWPNYYLALMELLMRDPEADAFLLVQDDVIFYDRQNLREHLEGVLWPADPIGLVSLYCSQASTRPKPGWHRIKGKLFPGALAFVFSRELAKRFVCDPLVLEHRWCHPKHGLANIDSVIGSWAIRQGVAIHYPTPSLAQHVGDTSTIWLHMRSADDRRADRFAGDLE